MTARITVDRDGTVVAWNADAAKLLGYSPGDAIGRSMEFFIPQEYRADHWTGFHRAIANEKLAFGPSDVLPVEMIHQDGARLSIDVNIVAHRDDGRIKTLTATLTPAPLRR